MSTDKYQNRYRIKSARAVWHDYNGGAYFITICTKNHEHFFGKIENSIMQLSEIGQYVSENMQNINIHYPYADVPLFVVMPNHIHAIVIIDVTNCRDVARNVSTQSTPSPTDIMNEITNPKMTEIAKHQSLLCITIRGFKSAITKFANENSINFAWQTRFHDHIVRNQDEMNRIASYIENNQETWDADSYNNKNIK